MGYCPQAVVLNEALTVDQHLDYFRAAYRLADLGRAHALVERLAYAQYRRTLVGTLSGGTQQKLNLTLALMHDPAVLLLDEPYQGFDWETYLRFWQIAADLRARGKAILVISHLIFDQRRFDTVYQLQDGRLQLVTSPIAYYDGGGPLMLRAWVTSVRYALIEQARNRFALACWSSSCRCGMGCSARFPSTRFRSAPPNRSSGQRPRPHGADLGLQRHHAHRGLHDLRIDPPEHAIRPSSCAVGYPSRC